MQRAGTRMRSEHIGDLLQMMDFGSDSCKLVATGDGSTGGTTLAVDERMGSKVRLRISRNFSVVIPQSALDSRRNSLAITITGARYETGLYLHSGEQQLFELSHKRGCVIISCLQTMFISP